MPEKVYNRIVIPNLTINRQGTAYGDALNYDYTEALEGLEKGSEEYHKAAARNIILHGPWTVEINQWNSMGLSLYLQALFAQSCSEIIITSPDRKTFDLSVRGLPDIAKKRIKYAKAESGNVYELVKSFFLPIAKDLSQRGLYDPKEDARQEPKNIRLNSTPIVSLASEIFLLAIAVVYKS